VDESDPLFSQPMPAPEIVGAVDDVEVPAEVDRDDLPDLVREQDLLHLLVGRRVAVVEGDDDLAVVPLLGVEDGLTFRFVGRHRLLGHHVDAAVEPLDDVFVVEAVDGRDHQQVRLRLLHHLVEVREGGAVGHADEIAGDDGALGVRVAESDELEDVRVHLDEVPAPHAAGTVAGADDGVAAFRGRLAEGLRRKQRGAKGGGSGRLHELAAGTRRNVGHVCFSSRGS
jgi:hypothetical protein